MPSSTLARSCTHDGCAHCRYVPVTLDEPPARFRAPARHRWWEHPRDLDRLQTLCWCERRIVTVTRTDLIRGVTDVCGANDCRRP